MKNFKDLKYLALVCLLIMFNSCSSDESGLEIIEEAENSEVIQSKSSSCDLSIYVTFNFDPQMTPAQRMAHKDSYYNRMSNNFTICRRIKGSNRGSCDKYERWVVNHNEYKQYLLDPDGGGGQETGTNNRSNDGDLGEVPPRFFIEDCFDNSENEDLYDRVDEWGNGLIENDYDPNGSGDKVTGF